MKVALSGYYGFGNAGDEALLEGLVRGLEAAGHQPVVLSNDPEGTRAVHRVAARHRVYGVARALFECQALVSGGGGLLQDKSSARSLDYYLWLLRLARTLGKRSVVYGQSIGPLSAEGRRKVAKVLRGVPVAVRDQASRVLLAGLAIESQLVADPALLLPEPAPPERSQRPVLLVPRAGYPELTKALAAVAVQFAADDCPVEVVSLHPREDEAECLGLSSALAGLPIRRTGDHREALRLFKGARMVVSARLHGLIFASVTRTPALGLVYDPKVAGFLAESGGKGFEPPIDHEALVAAAREAGALDEAVRTELTRRASWGIDWLDRILRSQPDTMEA